MASSLLPFIIRMSGVLYLVAAILLGARFIQYAHQLHRNYSDELSRKLFRFSIIYLAVLFGALLLDHWVRLI
jgi:protoheme IX farnesyltransferase